jgi:uncharacterized protein YutE (UPF0331/DUF86 family)
MSNLNMALIRQRAQEIRESATLLKEYARVSEEEFIKNRQIADAAKYRLLVAIESSIAICNHLVSRLAQKAPETFAECFEILKNQKVISEALCEKLQQMSRFRNLIIHGYWKIDDAKVHQILAKDLGDFDAYLLSVEASLPLEGQQQ